MLGGILLLEARALNHAISLMSKHPGVRMVRFEIRPADEAMNRLVAERNAAVAKSDDTEVDCSDSASSIRPTRASGTLG
jgi:hypothetical protein